MHAVFMGGGGDASLQSGGVWETWSDRQDWMRRSAARNLSWRWHNRHCRSSWVASLHTWNCMQHHDFLIYLYTELYQKKYLNKLLNMHEWMNENIWTTIRASWQRPVAWSVKAETARCEVKGSTPHVRWSFFEVIYDIVRLQLFRTYNVIIICLYPILTMQHERKIMKLKFQ